MTLDALMLSRIQFAFTISFHIVFPAFTIGLSAYVATLLGMRLWTKNEGYGQLARFWTKVFAVSFAMGVVSGIVLSYQFGTNWSNFSRVVGNVIGPVIGYEVLTAFFLEASFLGVMLFGWKRVPDWLHFLAACIVAFGTALSAFWILSANSWMQFPAGHVVREGVAYPVDWWQIVFNPTFPSRFAHMLTAAYLTTAFVVLAVGARHMFSGVKPELARTMVRMSILMIAVTAPVQAYLGHWSGEVTAVHQPAKLAAMEGHWDGLKPGALVLLGWPNEAAGRNDYELAIPYLGSWIIFGDANRTFPGLNDFAPNDRPPVWPVFVSFRIMVGIGLGMIVFGWLGAVLWVRRQVFALDRTVPRLWMRTATYLWPAGFVAILAGWMVTEIGRQPWLATGVLRTKDALSPVTTAQVATSLALFVFVYSIVFAAGIYYINRLLARGPQDDVTTPPPGEPMAQRPLRAAQEGGRAAFGKAPTSPEPAT